MTKHPTVWGVHMGLHVGDRPVEGNCVAIGWPNMGNLSKIAPDREAFKVALTIANPDKKAGAIPVDAGTMFKFMNEIEAGDFVVYPFKSERMVNIGRFTGQTVYVANGSDEYSAQMPRHSMSAAARLALKFSRLRVRRQSYS